MPANVLNLEQCLQSQLFHHVIWGAVFILENLVLAPMLFPLYNFASICGLQMVTYMVNT